MAKMEIPSAESPELVRGNLKAAMAEAGAKNPHALWTVPPSQLRVIDGFNGRIRTPAYLEHLATIKQSIQENGYFQDKPIAGYVAKEDGDNVIYVTEGHTRFEAVRELIEEGHEIETVPVVVKPNGTSMEDLTIALVTSNEGRPFTPYEKALMVKRLVGMGVDEATIAKRLVMTPKYLSDLLTLAGAPKAVRDLVITDKVSATLAIQELSKHGAKATERLKAAVEKAQGAGKGKATAKHLDKPKKPAKAPQVAPEQGSREIEAADVLKIAAAAGIKGQDEAVLALAATLLDPYGVSVIQVEDPAAGL